jgi:hypothetical protein
MIMLGRGSCLRAQDNDPVASYSLKIMSYMTSVNDPDRNKADGVVGSVLFFDTAGYGRYCINNAGGMIPVLLLIDCSRQSLSPFTETKIK